MNWKEMYIVRNIRFVQAFLFLICSLFVAGKNITYAVDRSCSPDADSVAFYVDANFEGNCTRFGRGDFRNYTDFGLPDNSISSIEVGANVQVVLCKDKVWGDDCLRFTGEVSDLGPTRVGNSISSGRIEVRGEVECPPGDNQVTLYQHAGFLQPCHTFDIGNYNNPAAMQFPNDAASSVLVGTNVQAILCKGDDYGDDCQPFKGQWPSFDNTRIGDNQVSSIKVQPVGTFECFPGPNEAAFFVHSDYIAPCVVRGIGDYPNAGAIGLHDDSISSMIVGQNVQVCAHGGENFSGSSGTFTNFVGELAEGAKEAGGNDSISSLQVQNVGASCQSAIAMSPGVTPSGYKAVAFANCTKVPDTLDIWLQDTTAGNDPEMKGSVPNGSDSNPCNGPWVSFDLVDGHVYNYWAIDPDAESCDKSIQPIYQSINCVRGQGTVTGGEGSIAYVPPII
jgi:hypothetical protein